MFLRKLAISNFLARKTRTALTVAAITLSVSLVVAVTTGYASVRGAVQKFVDRYMGAIDAQVIRKNDPRGPIREAVLAALREDRDVKVAHGRIEIDTPLILGDDKMLEGRMVQVIGVERPQDKRVEDLLMEKGQGKFFDTSDGNVAVIDQALAERIKGGVGTAFTLPGTRKTTLTVVGIVHKPELLAQQINTAYVPLHTLQRYQGWDPTGPEGPQVNSISIELNKGASPREFEARWEKRLQQIDPNLKMKLARDSRAEIDRNMGSIDLLSYLGGTVSMLAATFIVFSSLSMGVTERQRSLAMLRAVGVFRSQIGWLVVIEGMLLAAVGVVLGVPLGLLWVKLLTLWYSDVFSAGVVVSWGGVAFGSAGSILCALAASALPAWWATRVSPLEAMTPDAAPPSARTPIWAAVAAVPLICIDPFLFFGPLGKVVGALGPSDPQRMTDLVQLAGHFLLGLPAMFLGFFLLAPLFVKVVEVVMGPIVAAMFGLNFALLRQQLSSGLWRAAGTCAALMVGLAVLVVMQVQGHSALSGWRLPTKFPDIFIVSPTGGFLSAGGLTAEQQKQLEEMPEITESTPIAIASPEFGSKIFGLALAALKPDATMFFGIDPAKALDMMDLEFRDGDKANAKRMMTAGRAITLKDGSVLYGSIVEQPKNDVITDALGHQHIVPKGQVQNVEHGRFLIVTNEFRELKNLGVGDKFPLKRTDGKVVDYQIVGVVWSPGMDVIVSVFDMGRQFEQRTVSSVFGTLEDAKSDFGVDRVYLFAANLRWDVERVDLLEQLKKKLNMEGFKAGDVRHIKEKIVKAFNRLLLLASSVAFAAMAVASLGVMNTVMAGIRTRRWQFGVLRSIGVTRSQLLRLVLAEAVLLGLVACALGLSAGTIMSADAHRLSVVTTGYNPPIAVPWDVVGIGVGIVMFISLAASLWPAIAVARSEPLTLLQAGRAAT